MTKQLAVATHFERQFESLTGKPPLSWQRRLYHDHFAKNDLCSVIDLPTGLGKTMVMAIWLIARETNGKLPRRLIYVVDRRTVVDQASDLAKKLVDNWIEKKIFNGVRPAISTLRGQLADNREWSRDPSRAAIIIGTVDLIGSALLFSGYRSSYKRRPLEAGLLGQDSLLVLDEAHLSKPFEKLLGSVEAFQRARGCDKSSAEPMRVVRMSATSPSNAAAEAFRLEGDLEGQTGDFADKTVRERYNAKKRLTTSPLGEKDRLTDELAGKAIALAEDDMLQGKRIVVFVRKPDNAMKIADAIRKYQATKTKPGPFADSVEQLTGTMRGLERDKLVEEPVFKNRWLNGNLDASAPANQQAVFLISTSAGEVGFDLNADHMVCDATTIDSFIQRLGRANRRGSGDAHIHLLVEPPKKDKDGNPKKPEGLERAVANTIELLQGVDDVSPNNIAKLKAGEWKDRYAAACSPEPETVELTDILLDAWSMTSITERMPGRPDVGPWLRGLEDEQAQTTVAWRAELDLDGFAVLDPYDIEEWLDAHRILTHESLSVKTSDAAIWIKERWAVLSDSQKRVFGERPVIINRAGMEVVLVTEVVGRLSRDTSNAEVFLRGAQLVVPASFGGIRRGVGLLDPTEPKLDGDEGNKSPEEQEAILKARQSLIDVADVRSRYREKIVKPERGEAALLALDPKAVKPSNYARHTLEVESDDDKTVRIVSYVPRPEKLEVGLKQQSLKEHVGAVRRAADKIIETFQLAADDGIRRALELAADFHDHGKNRERWQRIAGGQASPTGQDWLDATLGKSGTEMKRDPRGYRHEFGSLCEFTDSFDAGKLLGGNGKPISRVVFDLAMHLIATHHGRGRPHFPNGGFDPDHESRSDKIHSESVRRFARLQRKYGWWHLAWLENLLRCADALASAGQKEEEDPSCAGGDAI